MPEISSIERLAYLAHAKSKAFLRKLDRARSLVAYNTDHTISVSWGKDSVVMLHLAYEIIGNICAVHGKYKEPAERFEDIESVRDRVLSRLTEIKYKETLVTGNWQMYEKVGHFFTEPITKEENQAHTWYRKQWSEEMAAATGNKVMIGMRPDESRIRRMLVARFGAEYITKQGRSTVLPLVGWSGQDVWAYLVSRNLPCLKIYDVQPDRNKARSDFSFGEKGVSQILMTQGQWLYWKEAYPNHFRIWQNRWPEMKQLCTYV